MKKQYLLLLLLFLSQAFQAQSYLRVVDPNDWWARSTDFPEWAYYADEGIFESVSILLTPLGVYTEVEVFATIADPGVFTWGDNLEIIWQFELPSNAIVHDSWLWVENDIIRADIVDYWTALNTYEEIVGRNQDPSFLFIKPDNRYELRVFPLPQNTSRRVKMSFLVPSDWSRSTVAQSVVQSIFQSTSLFNSDIQLAVATDPTWGVPTLQMGATTLPMNQLVTGADGRTFHLLAVDPYAFTEAEEVHVSWEAPFDNSSNTFLRTYQQDDEQFYQLAFAPDWEAALPGNVRRELFLINLDDTKTTETPASFANILRNRLGAYYRNSDWINMVVPTSDGAAFLSDNWITVEDALSGTLLQDFIASQNSTDMHVLFDQGLQWASSQGDATHLYLLAANGDYTYPPLAEETAAAIVPLLLTDVPFTLLDFQNQQVSIFYYQNELYEANNYLYELINSQFSTANYHVTRDQNQSFSQAAAQLFEPNDRVSGITDYNVSLQNGICYQRYNLGSPTDNQVLLQVGKMVGQPPFEVSGTMLTDDNQLIRIEANLPAAAIATGDTLMQEMWYGQYLKELFQQVSSNEDRQAVIEISRQQRILTPLTAFIALEPSQGGVPCDECLDDGGIIIATEEPDSPTKLVATVTPNPASTMARITVALPEGASAQGWQAVLIDASGRVVAHLDLVSSDKGTLVWEWVIPEHQPAGLYVCKLTNNQTSIVAKIVVVK